MKQLYEYLIALGFVLLLALLTFNFIGSEINKMTLDTRLRIENLQR